MAAFIDASGATQQIEANLDMVRAAKENGMSFRDYVNSTYTTDADRFGDAFSQMCASEGIVLQPNKQYGMKASSLDAVLNGRPLLEAGAIVRNPSNQGRVLLMPAIGALVEDRLVADLNMNADEFDRIIAQDDTIADEWLLWPEINFAGPEAARSQVTSQLAKPDVLGAIYRVRKVCPCANFVFGHRMVRTGHQVCQSGPAVSRHRPSGCC